MGQFQNGKRLASACGAATEEKRRHANINRRWKVYDVLVEGVSLVTTYRRVFQEEVQRSGIDGLIKVLNAKNSKLVRS